MALMGVNRFERFFRAAAGLDVDKDDLRRYSDFVSQKVHDLLVIGQATAKANARDVIEPWDLPVTTGLEESVRDFEWMDEEVELRQRSWNSWQPRPRWILPTARRQGRGCPCSSAA